MFLLFLEFLARTNLTLAVKHLACGFFVTGVLCQSGGFFLHMVTGEPDRPSIGTTIATVGAVLLTIAIGVLVYGIVLGRADVNV